MKEIDLVDLRQINGGFNQEAYDAGKVVGDELNKMITTWGILCILFL